MIINIERDWKILTFRLSITSNRTILYKLAAVAFPKYINVFEIVNFANGPSHSIALIVQTGTTDDVPDAPI